MPIKGTGVGNKMRVQEEESVVGSGSMMAASPVARSMQDYRRAVAGGEVLCV